MRLGVLAQLGFLMCECAYSPLFVNSYKTLATSASQLLFFLHLHEYLVLYHKHLFYTHSAFDLPTAIPLFSSRKKQYTSGTSHLKRYNGPQNRCVYVDLLPLPWSVEQEHNTSLPRLWAPPWQLR